MVRLYPIFWPETFASFSLYALMAIYIIAMVKRRSIDATTTVVSFKKTKLIMYVLDFTEEYYVLCSM